MSPMTKNRSNSLRIIACALLLLITAAGAPSRLAEEDSLPNFHKVGGNLYRGAQPRAGGISRLKALGVKTIINLRGADEGARVEEAEARAAGLNYFNVPLPGLSRPPDDKVEKVLALIKDPQNWPVFVHCNHGRDRTGTIIACYRISHDGWNLEEAMKEAKRYGLSWVQVGMKDYIKDYARKNAQASLKEERGPCPPS
ncbi:MAG: tyrosine-protein phosphatase [Acidobacteriota bacterium]|nr:tyrosine-protein phosphatase [Acidobacteriota bacterium]